MLRRLLCMAVCLHASANTCAGAGHEAASDPVNCPHSETHSDTCWANSAWRMCPVDRQGAYEKVMAKRGGQTVKPKPYSVDPMGRFLDFHRVTHVCPTGLHRCGRRSERNRSRINH